MISAIQLHYLLRQEPAACAQISGSSFYPNINGFATFYQVTDGVVLVIDVKGLPSRANPCGPSFFGLYIHEGSQCTGTNEDPFAYAGLHYNPRYCIHPEHAGGVLSPLLASQGEAFMVVSTGGLSVEEIIGRTILIHSSAEHFTMQPSGNSEEDIACGQIVRSGCVRR